MAQDTFNFKDGTLYTINIDVPNKDINVERTKAGNVRRALIKQYGIGLIRDELVVNYAESLEDSEGDPLPLPSNRNDVLIRDSAYIDDVNAYSQNGAVAFAKLFIDVLLKQRLPQTRVYKADGTFVAPAYFSVAGNDPTTPGGSDGSVVATIDEANGYSDLQVRIRKDGGTWGTWQSITTQHTFSNKSAGFYEVELKSNGTALLIQPIESVELIDPVA